VLKIDHVRIALWLIHSTGLRYRNIFLLRWNDFIADSGTFRVNFDKNRSRCFDCPHEILKEILSQRKPDWEGPFCKDHDQLRKTTSSDLSKAILSKLPQESPASGDEQESKKRIWTDSWSDKIFEKRRLARISNIVVDVLKQHLNVKQKNLRILDMGCSDGKLLHDLKDRLIKSDDASVQIIGMDKVISPHTKSPHELQLVWGDIFNPPIQPHTMDLIICAEVIEHMPFPQDLLETIRDLLSDKGYALITTPNANSLIEFTWNILKRMRSIKQKKHDAVQQVLSFDPKRMLASPDIPRRHDVFAHVSVHSTRQWKKIIENVGGLKVCDIFPVILSSGGPDLDHHPILGKSILAMDALMHYIPLLGHICYIDLAYLVQRV